MEEAINSKDLETLLSLKTSSAEASKTFEENRSHLLCLAIKTRDISIVEVFLPCQIEPIHVEGSVSKECRSQPIAFALLTKGQFAKGFDLQPYIDDIVKVLTDKQMEQVVDLWIAGQFSIDWALKDSDHIWPPIYSLCRQGSEASFCKVFPLLIQNHPNILNEYHGPLRRYLLTMATEFEHNNIFLFLMKNHSAMINDMNVTDAIKRSALWYCCQHNNIDGVRAILMNKLFANNVDVCSAKVCDRKYGACPMWLACVEKNEDIVKMFIANESSCEQIEQYLFLPYNDASIFRAACYAGNNYIINLLVDHFLVKLIKLQSESKDEVILKLGSDENCENYVNLTVNDLLQLSCTYLVDAGHVWSLSRLLWQIYRQLDDRRDWMDPNKFVSPDCVERWISLCESSESPLSGCMHRFLSYLLLCVDKYGERWHVKKLLQNPSMAVHSTSLPSSAMSRSRPPTLLSAFADLKIYAENYFALSDTRTGGCLRYQTYNRYLLEPVSTATASATSSIGVPDIGQIGGKKLKSMDDANIEGLQLLAQCQHNSEHGVSKQICSVRSTWQSLGKCLLPDKNHDAHKHKQPMIDEFIARSSCSDKSIQVSVMNHLQQYSVTQDSTQYLVLNHYIHGYNAYDTNNFTFLLDKNVNIWKHENILDRPNARYMLFDFGMMIESCGSSINIYDFSDLKQPNLIGSFELPNNRSYSNHAMICTGKQKTDQTCDLNMVIFGGDGITFSQSKQTFTVSATLAPKESGDEGTSIQSVDCKCSESDDTIGLSAGADKENPFDAFGAFDVNCVLSRLEHTFVINGRDGKTYALLVGALYFCKWLQQRSLIIINIETCNVVAVVPNILPFARIDSCAIDDAGQLHMISDADQKHLVFPSFLRRIHEIIEDSDNFDFQGYLSKYLEKNEFTLNMQYFHRAPLLPLSLNCTNDCFTYNVYLLAEIIGIKYNVPFRLCLYWVMKCFKRVASVNDNNVVLDYNIKVKDIDLHRLFPRKSNIFDDILFLQACYEEDASQSVELPPNLYKLTSELITAALIKKLDLKLDVFGYVTCNKGVETKDKTLLALLNRVDLGSKKVIHSVPPDVIFNHGIPSSLPELAIMSADMLEDVFNIVHMTHKGTKVDYAEKINILAQKFEVTEEEFAVFRHCVLAAMVKIRLKYEFVMTTFDLPSDKFAFDTESELQKKIAPGDITTWSKYTDDIHQGLAYIMDKHTLSGVSHIGGIFSVSAGRVVETVELYHADFIHFNPKNCSMITPIPELFKLLVLPHYMTELELEGLKVLTEVTLLTKDIDWNPKHPSIEEEHKRISFKSRDVRIIVSASDRAFDDSKVVRHDWIKNTRDKFFREMVFDNKTAVDYCQYVSHFFELSEKHVISLDTETVLNAGDIIAGVGSPGKWDLVSGKQKKFCFSFDSRYQDFDRCELSQSQLSSAQPTVMTHLETVLAEDKRCLILSLVIANDKTIKWGQDDKFLPSHVLLDKCYTIGTLSGMIMVSLREIRRLLEKFGLQQLEEKSLVKCSGHHTGCNWKSSGELVNRFIAAFHKKVIETFQKVSEDAAQYLAHFLVDMESLVVTEKKEEKEEKKDVEKEEQADPKDEKKDEKKDAQTDVHVHPEVSLFGDLSVSSKYQTKRVWTQLSALDASTDKEVWLRAKVESVEASESQVTLILSQSGKLCNASCPVSQTLKDSPSMSKYVANVPNGSVVDVLGTPNTAVSAQTQNINLVLSKVFVVLRKSVKSVKSAIDVDTSLRSDWKLLSAEVTVLNQFKKAFAAAHFQEVLPSFDKDGKDSSLLSIACQNGLQRVFEIVRDAKKDTKNVKFEMELMEHYHECLLCFGSMVFDALSVLKDSFDKVLMVNKHDSRILILTCGEACELVSSRKHGQMLNGNESVPMFVGNELSKEWCARLADLVRHKFGTEIFVLDKCPIKICEKHVMMDVYDKNIGNFFKIFSKDTVVMEGWQYADAKQERLPTAGGQVKIDVIAKMFCEPKAISG